jgi:hypothetical protein
MSESSNNLGKILAAAADVRAEQKAIPPDEAVLMYRSLAGEALTEEENRRLQKILMARPNALRFYLRTKAEPIPILQTLNDDRSLISELLEKLDQGLHRFTLKIESLFDHSAQWPLWVGKLFQYNQLLRLTGGGPDHANEGIPNQEDLTEPHDILWTKIRVDHVKTKFALNRTIPFGVSIDELNLYGLGACPEWLAKGAITFRNGFIEIDGQTAAQCSSSDKPAILVLTPDKSWQPARFMAAETIVIVLERFLGEPAKDPYELSKQGLLIDAWLAARQHPDMQGEHAAQRLAAFILMFVLNPMDAALRKRADAADLPPAIRRRWETVTTDRLESVKHYFVEAVEENWS